MSVASKSVWVIKNWQTVLRRAWSVRLLLIAGLFSGLEVFLPLIHGYWEVPPGTFAALSGLVAMCALIARILAQSKFGDE